MLIANAQDDPGYELTNQGNLAAAHGDYAEAARLHSQALAVWRAMGPGHEAFVATGLTNLGEAYCGEGKWQQGADAFEQALALNRTVLGPRHIRTLANLNALGNARLALRDYAGAEKLYGEALPVAREAFPHDIQLALTLSGMAAVLSRTGRLEEALPPAEEALRIGIDVEGNRSRVVASMLANVAQIHDALGRPARAIPLYRKARAIYEQIESPDSPLVASLISAEGIAFLYDGDTGNAERDLERAVNLLAPCKEYRLMLAVAESNLGLLRMRQHRYMQAEDLLTRALSLEEEHAPLPVNDMAVTIGLLAKLRELQKRPADAATLRQRAAALRVVD